MSGSLSLNTGLSHYALTPGARGASAKVGTPGPQPVSLAMMGDEFLGFGFLTQYEGRHQHLNSTHLRWPGGIVVEDGIVGKEGYRQQAFDFSYANLADLDKPYFGGQREGLREIIRAAKLNEQSLSIVVPTARYAAELLAEISGSSISKALASGDPVRAFALLDSSVLEALREEVGSLVSRLLGGSFGELPKNFTIEVGSEYYVTDVWNNLTPGATPVTGNKIDPALQKLIDVAAANNPDLTVKEVTQAYGLVFATIADEIGRTNDYATKAGENEQGIDFTIAIQLGRHVSVNPSQGSSADNIAFRAAFDAIEGSIDAVDSLIWHRYVAEWSQINDRIFEQEGRDSLQGEASAWEAIAGRELGVLAGWLAPAIESKNTEFYGAPAMTSILQLFSNLVNFGAETASIFGTDGGEVSSNGAKLLSSGTSTYIGGKLFALMSEVLPGMYLLDQNIATVSANDHNTAPVTGTTRPGINNTVNSYAYEDDSKIVLFLCAKDYEGAASEGKLPFDLSVQGQYINATVTRLYDPNWKDRNGSYVPGEIEILGQELKADGERTNLRVNFEHGYETIRVILAKSSPGQDGTYITGSSESNSIFGSQGGDNLFGGGGADALIGFSGNDTLFGGSGDDILNGGRGDDHYFVDSAGDTIIESLWGGVDEVHTSLSRYGLSEHLENLTFDPNLTSARVGLGNKSDNVLLGGAGSNTLYGGEGNDVLKGSTTRNGASTLFGGFGDDVYIFDSHFQDESLNEIAVEYSGGGIDTIVIEGNYTNIVLDLREIVEIENVMYMAQGGATIFGSLKENRLEGGNDDDTIFGGAGNDTLVGHAGVDRLVGGFGDDIYHIEVANGALVDIVIEIAGGGVDTIIVDGYVSNFVIDLREMPEVENSISFAKGGATIFGNTRENLLEGGSGDDTIFGGNGEDTLVGHGGIDRLVGGRGNDLYHVGSEKDRSVDRIVELSGEGIDTVVVHSLPTYALERHVENLTSEGDMNFRGYGNDLNNSISGGDGDDVLSGEAFDPNFDLASAQVYRLYSLALGRLPDQAGHLNWVSRLIDGEMSLKDVANAFVSSGEFQHRFSAESSGEFVDLLFHNVLGRAANAGGRALWIEQIDGGNRSRGEVVLGFSESAEHVLRAETGALEFSRAGYQAEWADDIFRLYVSILGRTPLIDGLNNWTDSLVSGQTYLNVVNGFVTSTEFRSRFPFTEVDASAFVDLLYVNVLDRAANSDGRTYWTAQVDSGKMTVAQVVASFAQSSEFSDRTAVDFRNWSAAAVSDRIDGGSGNNLLFGGIGSDTFVFAKENGGMQTVADLASYDKIELQGFGYASVADALAHVTSMADGAALFSDQGVQIYFYGVAPSELTEDQFLF